jgi:threonine dehydrogenase-like Zn-dependent dehydrogenase
LRALRFHHRPVRYLLTRLVASRRPTFALGRFGCVSLDNVEQPALPGPEWVLVRTTLSGICGSDLGAITAGDSFTLEPFGAFPFTFGHENVGVIVEAGANAGAWQPGHRVIVNPMLACEQRGLPACPPCARGEYGLCRRTGEGASGPGPMIGYAPRVGGGWAPLFLAHRSQLHAADGLADEVAVLADPLASALRPVLLHPPRADDVVLVIGAGTIGILTVAALRATGWTGPIAVLGRYDFQLDMAERAGASHRFRAPDEVYRWAASLPDAAAYDPSLAPRFVEGGPSLVYDTVGTERTVRDTFALTREGGRVIVVGATAKLTADWTRVWYRQLTIAGVFAYGRAPYRGGEHDIYDAATDVLRGGAIAGLDMVTHTFPLDRYHDAIATALDKAPNRSTKVAFRLSQS